MIFDTLIQQIDSIDQQARRDTARAVNVGLTLRNWAIGFYIGYYQLEGEDRASYGEHLFDSLASSLKQRQVKSCDRRQLYRYHDFFKCYPHIVGTLSPSLAAMLPTEATIRSSDDKSQNVGTASPLLRVPAEMLVSRLSYSHFELLLALNDPLQRAFYEVECLRGGWSVRELKRQIGSVSYERTALSKDKEALSQHINSLAETDKPELILRDPVVFEFLGVRPQDTMLESDLEHALLDKLEPFLLELGRGFCFEARQKRILIGGEYFFVDLVFYHRLLKCHILVELKTEPFNHENLGQLNTYLNWYAENERSEGDNLPIGILLCTGKNEALVRYATAGMDNQLFVSRYQVALPDKDQIATFIAAQMKDVTS